MPRFLRDNAGFVAVPCYISDGSVSPPFGHSPIALTFTGIGINWFDDNTGQSSHPPPRANFVQLWIDGALQDVELDVGHGGSASRLYDTPFTVPAVTAANVDGASRFGTLTANLGDAELVTLLYQPTNSFDAGKQVMGIGSKKLAGAAGGVSDGRFSPPQYWFGWPGGWTEGGPPFLDSDVFASTFELLDTGALAGMVDGVAATPIAQTATWDDFTIVLRAVPDGTSSFNLRVDGVTVKTLTVTAGSQRVWTFPGSIDISVGQRVCWQYVGGSGSGLDGEILWTSNVQPTDTDVSGAGVSAGESGGGL